jgi:hypothetical protein
MLCPLANVAELPPVLATWTFQVQWPPSVTDPPTSSLAAAVKFGS